MTMVHRKKKKDEWEIEDDCRTGTDPLCPHYSTLHLVYQVKKGNIMVTGISRGTGQFVV